MYILYHFISLDAFCLSLGHNGRETYSKCKTELPATCKIECRLLRLVRFTLRKSNIAQKIYCIICKCLSLSNWGILIATWVVCTQTYSLTKSSKICHEKKLQIQNTHACLMTPTHPCRPRVLVWLGDQIGAPCHGTGHWCGKVLMVCWVGGWEVSRLNVVVWRKTKMIPSLKLI